MIERKKKACKVCGNDRYLYARGMCLTCDRNVNPGKHGAGLLKRSTITKYRREPTGEAELFKEIWSERPHFCTNCKQYLGLEMRTWYFAHIKSKGAHPELRLEKSNIMLLCLECHTAYDQGTKEQYNRRTKH